MEKIINFFKKNIFRRIIGIIIGAFLVALSTISFLLANIYTSLKIDYTNELNDNLIKTIGLTSGIATILSIITSKDPSNDIKEIKQQNEEMKAELEEIKKIVQEEPKEYKIDVKVIT